MAVDPSVVINIAAEYTGNKAFKQAEKATDKLGKSVKNLAKTIGLTFGTAAVLAYAKASVKAAAQDEKAQKQLALALKNVGLGRDAASSEAYIQSLQSQFGIVDDLLRPAYQTLAVATRNSVEAQRLFNLALDISASTTKPLAAVTGALSKAYLGNNTALSKLGVGISKADLKAKSFNDITEQLSVTFAGSATAAANTFQGSIDKLAVASANAKETIGTGLIDAVKLLGGEGGIGTVTKAIDDLALSLSEVIVSTAKLVIELKKLPVLGDFLGRLFSNPLNLPKSFLVFGEGGLLDAFRDYGKVAGLQNAADNAHLKALQNSFKIISKTTTKTTTITKLSAEQLKNLRLKTAIEKGNLALGKGADVFNMDAIQLNAALISQAEQLGKATSAAQLLAIANDTARLNVKKSMLELEQAIASGDLKAIETATAKLNKDLQILGTLLNQKYTLQNISDILTSLKPKDLINQQNLDDALAKIAQMLAMLASMGSGSSAGAAGSLTAKPNVSGGVTALSKSAAELALAKEPASVPTSLSPAQISGMRYAAQGAAQYATMLSKIDLEGIAQTSFTQGINSGGSIAASLSGARYAAQGAASMGGGNVTVTIVDKTSGLIQVVQDAVIQNKRYGNNLDFAGAIS